MDLDRALGWAAERKLGVLVTIRSDGRPQTSDIVYVVDDGRFVISLTDGRAKTANMRRDPRVVLHVTSPDTWSYVSFDAVAELSAVATAVDDETSDRLVDYYRVASGQEHDDWAGYRQAMVAEGRLLATVTPSSAVGQINR